MESKVVRISGVAETREGREQSAPQFKGCCAEWGQRAASPDGCPLIDSEKNNTCSFGNHSFSIVAGQI